MNTEGSQIDQERENADSKPHLVLFDTDAAVIEDLKSHSVSGGYISLVVGHGTVVTSSAHLDAVWVTPMMGLELFGANPPYPLYRAVVLKTPEAQRESGLPRFAVMGVAVSPNDSKDPEYQLRLILQALLNAVREHNHENDDKILRIGILLENLLLKKLGPKKVLDVIEEFYVPGAALQRP